MEIVWSLTPLCCGFLLSFPVKIKGRTDIASAFSLQQIFGNIKAEYLPSLALKANKVNVAEIKNFNFTSDHPSNNVSAYVNKLQGSNFDSACKIHIALAP